MGHAWAWRMAAFDGEVVVDAAGITVSVAPRWMPAPPATERIAAEACRAMPAVALSRAIKEARDRLKRRCVVYP